MFQKTSDSSVAMDTALDDKIFEENDSFVELLLVRISAVISFSCSHTFNIGLYFFHLTHRFSAIYVQDSMKCTDGLMVIDVKK